MNYTAFRGVMLLVGLLLLIGAGVLSDLAWSDSAIALGFIGAFIVFGAISSSDDEERSAPKTASNRPRVRIRQDGWIRHVPGPFPFDANLLVEVADSHGCYGPRYASETLAEWWEGRATAWGRNVLFYRIVDAPPAVRP